MIPDVAEERVVLICKSKQPDNKKKVEYVDTLVLKMEVL
jgi:hypothetical protein